jgi:hypothetical protein
MRRSQARRARTQQAMLAVTAVAALVVATPSLAGAATGKPTPLAVQRQQAAAASHQAAVAAALAKAKVTAADDGGDDDEARNSLIATQQWTEARTAPGVVAPGAYGAAWAALQALPEVGGSWAHVTNKVYNSDDQRYRDYNSNSSGGSGDVTGRVTGLAADDAGYVYAGGASGVPRPAAGAGRRSRTRCPRCRPATSSSTRPVASGTRPARPTPARRASWGPACSYSPSHARAPSPPR